MDPDRFMGGKPKVSGPSMTMLARPPVAGQVVLQATWANNGVGQPAAAAAPLLPASSQKRMPYKEKYTYHALFAPGTAGDG